MIAGSTLQAFGTIWAIVNAASAPTLLGGGLTSRRDRWLGIRT